MRKILKKNIDCAMTYMAYLDEDGNIYLEIGREEDACRSSLLTPRR